MLRKIFKTGNSIVVSLPEDILEQLGLPEGEDAPVALDREQRLIVISPVEIPLADSLMVYLTADQVLFIRHRLGNETGGEHGIRDIFWI